MHLQNPQCPLLFYIKRWQPNLLISFNSTHVLISEKYKLVSSKNSDHGIVLSIFLFGCHPGDTLKEFNWEVGGAKCIYTDKV